MTSYVASFLPLRLAAGRLLTRILSRVPRLRDRLPVAKADADASPGTAPQDLYRIWVCMKNRTDGRPCCAVGDGNGTGADLLAALQTRIALALRIEEGADPSLAPGGKARVDVRPSGCLDLCDHALVAIAHTGVAATRTKPPKSKLDRFLHPRLAQFTNATPADAQAILHSLLPPTPPRGHQ